MRIVVFQQCLHLPVEIAEVVNVLPSKAGYFRATGTGLGVAQPFVGDGSLDGYELIILVFTHSDSGMA
jgi:hypothetical protein